MSDVKAAYTGARGDVAKLVPGQCVRILDVGCAIGALGELLMRRQRARIVGIEVDRQMADVASTKLDHVLVESVENWDAIAKALEGQRFDCVICADVLEHLTDPWTTLRNLSELLEPGGHLVASLPNVGHLDTFVSVFLRKRWPYRPRGIHDSSHMRSFARKNVLALFSQAGLEIVRMSRNYRVIERPHYINRYAKFLAAPPLRDLLTYQFIVLARKQS